MMSQISVFHLLCNFATFVPDLSAGTGKTLKAVAKKFGMSKVFLIIFEGYRLAMPINFLLVLRAM
jgi:hypothetical protein